MVRSRSRRRATQAAALALGLLLLLAVGAGVSVARTQSMRADFERQWAAARYPQAELLGAWSGMGRIVTPAGGDLGAHCDFAAQAVYGTEDDFDEVEAHYRAHTITLGGQPPVGIDVQPVPDEALSGERLRPGDPAEVARDALERTRVDLERARRFPTVYIAEAVSWGHAPWLDWRCR